MTGNCSTEAGDAVRGYVMALTKRLQAGGCYGQTLCERCVSRTQCTRDVPKFMQSVAHGERHHLTAVRDICEYVLMPQPTRIFSH